jgi:hypothetical protein
LQNEEGDGEYTEDDEHLVDYDWFDHSRSELTEKMNVV